VHLSWSLLSILSISHYFNTWTLGLQKLIVAMKSTIILSSIFAVFAAASPVNLDAREDPMMRIEFTLDGVPKGQADIPRTNKPYLFRNQYGGPKDNPFLASGVNVISGTGVCMFFGDIKLLKKDFKGSVGSQGMDATFKNFGAINNGNLEPSPQKIGDWAFLCMEKPADFKPPNEDPRPAKPHLSRDVSYNPLRPRNVY
jgi:hypothetical protein